MARNGYPRVVSDDFVRRYFGLFEYTTHDILTASSFLGLERIVTKMGLNHQTIGHLTNRNDNINDCSSHKLEFCERLIYFAVYGFLEFYSQNFGGRKSNGPCLEINQRSFFTRKDIGILGKSNDQCGWFFWILLHRFWIVFTGAVEDDWTYHDV